MLKHVQVNDKIIPVPVPIKTLREAFEWVDATLVKKSESITKLILDGTTLDVDVITGKLGETKLTKMSELTAVIENPVDLLIETLKAIYNHAQTLDQGVKLAAVEAWKQSENANVVIKDVLTDLNMISEMLDQLRWYFDCSHVDVAAIQGIGILLDRYAQNVASVFEKNDLKRCSTYLIHRVYPMITELLVESEAVLVNAIAFRDKGNEATGEQAVDAVRSSTQKIGPAKTG